MPRLQALELALMLPRQPQEVLGRATLPETPSVLIKSPQLAEQEEVSLCPISVEAKPHCNPSLHTRDKASDTILLSRLLCLWASALKMRHA